MHIQEKYHYLEAFYNQLYENLIVIWKYKVKGCLLFNHMQQRWGEFAIYRNKPNKIRNYLHHKGSQISEAPQSTRNPPMHHILKKQEASPYQTKKIETNRELKSQLAQLIDGKRRRITTERSSVMEPGYKSIIQHPRYSVVKDYLQRPIDIIKNNKLEMELDGKSSNQHRYKKFLRASNSPDDGRVVLRRIGLASRYNLMRGSKSERGKANKSDLSIEDKRLIRRSKQQKKDTEQVLNFQPKHKYLYKMSVQLLGVPKSDSNNSFIDGYVRENRLGKGGFSQVWSATQLQTGKKYAVKQMDAFNPYQTHLAEITFSTFFFEDGFPKPEFKNHSGIEGLLKMHGYHVRGQKVYVVYEQCTGSLGEFLFDIYEQRNYKRQVKAKQYRIIHKQLYRQMREDAGFLKKLVEQLAYSLELLQRCGIVHSDLKTSNVLINVDQNNQYSFKLVDYGSSFFFQNLQQYRLATPEYIPPELLNFLNQQKGNPYNHDLTPFTQNYCNISAIDIWGLGCILLEIVHGIPLWLNNQVKMTVNGRQKFGFGLLATQKRTYSQILERELNMISDLDRLLIQENNTRVVLDDQLRKIIKGCLQLNPALRIKPAEVLRILSNIR